jgi:hypothetical protein
MEVVVIGLVACCKTKLDRAAPARELYVSPLFRLSLAYAEARCERVYVASALHDLVEPDRVLQPYERTLTDLNRFQRTLFGYAVVRGLIDRHGWDFDLLVLAGAAYVTPIARALADLSAGLRLIEPLRGMQIGERLSFLSHAKPAERPVSPDPTTGGAPCPR